MSDGTDDDPFELDQDIELEEGRAVVIDHSSSRVAVIRTSDRNNFRKCRRRWNWSSHLRHNLTPIAAASPLWFGSGCHYAWEDQHGYNRWGHPVEAFKQYAKASHKAAKAARNNALLPPDFMDLVPLGISMLGYYADYWLQQRDPLKTFWYEGRPQVEVHALVKVPIQTPHYDEVYYGVTLDRVVQDDHDPKALWILDYKTAKRFETRHLPNDPQIGAYCWIGQQMYPGYTIAGFIYQQHRKEVIAEPRVNSTGLLATHGTKTTHRLYRRALINQYGDVLRAPKAQVDFLNKLVQLETPYADHFIRRDYIDRNSHMIESEGAKLMMELEEMLNPDLPLYPSPTRDCAHMCSFSSPCMSLDDGSDWEYELKIGYRPKDADFDHWRKFLPAETKEI